MAILNRLDNYQWLFSALNVETEPGCKQNRTWMGTL